MFPPDLVFVPAGHFLALPVEEQDPAFPVQYDDQDVGDRQDPGGEILLPLKGLLGVLPLGDVGDLPEDAHHIATSRVKWDWHYQDEHKIKVVVPKLSPQFNARLTALGKRIYKILGLSGYARIDLRVTEDEKIYVLEANANPDIGYGEEMSLAGEAAGLSYEQLLQRILNLGLKYRPDRARI